MSRERAEADLARLQTDIRRLEAQLHDARERAVKVAHYLEMASFYSEGAESGAPPVVRQSGGNSGLAVRAVISMLREIGRPMPTRDLVDALKRRGILIGGSNPVTNLSGYLSRADEVVADRTHGWRLREWAQDSEAFSGTKPEDEPDPPQTRSDDADDTLRSRQEGRFDDWTAETKKVSDVEEEVP